MGQTVQERSGRYDHRAAGNAPSVHQMYPAYTPVLNDERGHFGLLDVKVRFALEDFLHAHPVLLLVALRARRPDGWPSARVQKAKLDADRVGDLPHHAAQRVDLAHQVTLRDPADRRIAGHLGDQIRVHRDHRRPHPEAGAGARGFAAGVPSTDDYNVICNRAAHFRTIDNIVVCENSGHRRRGPRTRPCVETA